MKMQRRNIWMKPSLKRLPWRCIRIHVSRGILWHCLTLWVLKKTPCIWLKLQSIILMLWPFNSFSSTVEIYQLEEYTPLSSMTVQWRTKCLDFS
jgi:hypothetical protein